MKAIRAISINPRDRVAPTCSRTWLTGLRGPDAFKGAHGGPLDGTCVEQMVVPASALVRLPDHLSYAEGATLPCAAVTAWNAVFTQGDLRADQTVLLQGTAAVSLFSLQFAKFKGATVIMTSSSDQKLARVKDLGADHVINYEETTAWDKAVKALTAGKGADLVINVAGGGTLSIGQERQGERDGESDRRPGGASGGARPGPGRYPQRAASGRDGGIA